MTTLWKLTDEHGRTQGDTQWSAGVTHKAAGEADQPLCTDGWLHAYESPLLAVLLNPIHANFKNPRLWRAEGEVGKRDGQLKVGCRELRTLEEVALPEVTLEQRVRFAILCAKGVYRGTAWNEWAEWLSGKDRTARAAEVAEVAAAAEAAAAAAAASIDLIAISEAVVREEK